MIMNWLLKDNGTLARLLRTIIQGLIGVLIANLDYIVGGFQIAAEQKTMIVALTMAVLSPIMSVFNTKEE